MTTYEIPRDRWGKPVIKQPEGKAIAYYRASSYGDVLDDKTALTLWKQRMTALGLIERPDLQLAVAANRENKQALNQTVERAMEHSGATSKAGIGTSLHALTETLDRGEDLGFVPNEYQADLDVYLEATSQFKMPLIERFVVNDEWKIAGTPDRVVEYQGTHYIFDLKTGNVDYSWPKIAIQLASYADGKLYNPETGEREDLPEVHPYKGIVLHLPAGSGQASLHWVDLGVGRAGIRLASQVREWRTNTRKGVAQPMILDTPNSQKETA